MFGSKKEGGAPADTRINTVIGEGTHLSGTLRVEGSLLVNGDFEGTITASESAIIGKSGSVRAGIQIGRASCRERV